MPEAPAARTLALHSPHPPLAAAPPAKAPRSRGAGSRRCAHEFSAGRASHPRQLCRLDDSGGTPRVVVRDAPLRSPTGVLITLEGGEGVGKTTQARLLHGWLVSAGVPVTCVREPGGTPVGERLRGLLLDPGLAALEPEAEMLLFAAARAQAVAEVIRPALASGHVVVCDRFVESSLVYQGALGVDEGFIRTVNEGVTKGLRPDLTILFDLEREVARARWAAGAGAGDRVEARAEGYHESVRQRYLGLAASAGGRMVVVRAAGAPAAVHRAVRVAVAPVLRAHGRSLADAAGAAPGEVGP